MPAQGSLAHHIPLFYTCAFPFAGRLTGTAASFKKIRPVRPRPASTPFYNLPAIFHYTLKKGKLKK
jgi:hypothetical protein